jgi:hypothetical protein
MKVVIVTGMPRSGTSWLGQIINSHPAVLFRMEPLFAYRFKNIINEQSSCRDVNIFIDGLVDVTDDFMSQKNNQDKGSYPIFDKSQGEVLMFKTTRHHELLEKYLKCLPDLEVLGLVRHPCGAINSWLRSEKEFKKKGCKIDMDWKTGACRKEGIGEYWGFDDWLKLTRKFESLESTYNNFHIVKYSELVNQLDNVVSKLFSIIKLDVCPQTMNFLKECHTKHSDDPYAVFKSKEVVNSWKNSLREDIAETITRLTVAEGLEHYLD